MKYIFHIFILSFGFILFACGSPSSAIKKTPKEQPVVIANDSLEYEIIILDIGFNNYLNSIAQPVGFYTQTYLENKNQFYVLAWNNRVNNPAQFDPHIYENIINYDPNINYGYKVNYKLFNYFEFAQRKYRMTLR